MSALPLVIGALLVPPTANSASAHTVNSSEAPHLYTQSGNWRLCLDVEGGSSASGARVIQWECNHQTNQYMQFLYNGTENGRDFFQIYTGRGCLDVAGISQARGAKIQQWVCIPGQLNQQWFVTQRPYGVQSYQARHSGQCLDVPSGTTQTWPIVQMQQYTCNGTSAQNFWYFP